MRRALSCGRDLRFKDEGHLITVGQSFAHKITFLPKSRALRKLENVHIFNGEGGIRTRGTRKGHTGFRNRLDQPLRHLSITVAIAYTPDFVKLQEY